MLQASSAESGAGYQNPAAAGADALQKQAVAASAAGLGLRENVANRPTQANGLSAAKTGNSVSAAQSGSTPTAEAQAADDLFFEESAEAAELIANKPQSGVSGAAKPAGGGALPAGSGNDSLQGALQGTPASVGKTPENLDAARLTSAVPTNDGVEVPLSFDELNFVRVADAGAVIRNEAQSLPNQATSGNVTVQVAAEIARNLQNGQTRFQMRFDPPELGRVDVNLKVSADGSVQAHLIVERPETLDMFLRDQRGLERALEAAGLSSDAETLKFSLRDNGGQNPQFGQGGDGQSTGHQRSAEHGNNDAEPEITSSETLSMNVSEGRSGLDIKI
nr:flagellar hook-length control protein FliK [Roseibium hamelinense]